MKVFAVLAIIVLAGSSVESKSLAEAMLELRQVLRLHSWVAAWGVRRNADRDVCAFSNELNQPDVFDPAINRIDQDPLYQFIRATMMVNGVDWDDFMDNELVPALGYFRLVPSCTTLASGGVEGLRNQLRGYFDERLVESTVARLRVESDDFRQLFDTLGSNQDAVRVIRCSPEVQRVYQVKSSRGVDFDFVFQVIGIIFGWGNITQC